MTAPPDDTTTDLHAVIAELRAERDAALARETALAEVIAAINRSPGDPGPVFQTILQKAHSLCGATIGSLGTYDGMYLRNVAAHGYPPDSPTMVTGAPFRPTAGASQRLINGERLIHYTDVAAMPPETLSNFRDVIERLGVRTVLLIPLRKDGAYVGGISALRTEAKPFTDTEISLLESFAAQAVIAMENARLITEQREALEQQTATAEVLGVINASPGDLAPVFDAILEKAHHLCGAVHGVFGTYDGDYFRAVASRGLPAAVLERLKHGFHGLENPITRPLFDGARFVQIPDLKEIDHPIPKAVSAFGGFRTALFVPLRKDGTLLGHITALRSEDRPFTDKQIALLQNFAAQAVIAMENARLINEQREALEQQTATAEVLQIINASPGNLAPVFDAMLEKATRLCEAAFGVLWTHEGEMFRAAALRGVPPAYSEFVTSQPRGSSPGGVLGRLARGEPLVHTPDSASPPPQDAIVRTLVELGNIRTLLAVPLRKDDALLGAFTIYRKEVRPFSDKQIALLKNFADQAVIAMENARLLFEQREALEQQTATAEVLQVINASPGDLAPVFDAMLEKAMRLCGAAYGVLRSFDGKVVRILGSHGVPPVYAEFLARNVGTPAQGSGVIRALQTGQPAQTLDAKESVGYKSGAPGGRAIADLGGARTVLHVPLVKDQVSVGLFTFYRQEVRSFSDKQIALLENFAAQAVIAMENARLLTEQQEALEQQTATAEVLQVINASPGDLAPVFEAMLEKATRLCEAPFGYLRTWDGERFHFGAVSGDPQFSDWVRRRSPLQPDRDDDSPLGRIIKGEQVVRFTVAPGDEDHWNSAAFKEMVAVSGMRSGILVALKKDETLLGTISVYRQEVLPFSDKQVALLENFAAQAVIAMENARLLTEQQEALERQTATAEVLQVINASPGDLAPVFDAILEKAHSLCDAAAGTLTTYDGAQMRAVATRGGSPAWAEAVRRPRPPGSNDQQIISGNRYVEIPDLQALAPAPVDDATFRLTRVNPGWRTLLIVPLRRDDAVLGYISSYRLEVRPFSDKEISLFESFAAQAVIAMENARLLTETREALEQQTATAEVLQVINASPGDLAPVFDAMLERALHLCEAAFGVLWTYDGERIHAVALRGMRPAFAEFLTRTPHSVGPDNAHGRLLRGEPVVHIADLMDDEAYRSGDPMRRSLVELGSGRTLLAVPLRKDEAFLGDFVIYRQEVRPFSDKQIALLQSFAAQAVIAMENARLLDEIRQRQEELRVTFENMGDGVAMFDETQYLAAWNRKFQDILDLPDALLGQRRTYEEHLRFLAARGDFGPGVDTVEQIEELVASTGQPYGYERTRPDGRVIEIRRNPVPDGGFVLIYSDITERKRSEEEIRAARDAAETALRELRTAQANLIQAEKMASLGQLTAGIAHEIKNPLNFVNNFAALSVDLLSELKETAAPGFAALTEKQRAEVDEVSAMLTSNLEKITEHGKRADGIVKAMLEHSRGSSGERRMVDLNVLIDEALNLAYHGARAQDQSFNITLERDFGEGIVTIEVNPQDITRVFLNLFSNGFYATTKRARDSGDAGFMPTLKVTTIDAGDAVEIRVRDNGTGIPADIRDKLFQPFFTTKPTGEGTGLGLSITYDVVTQQHGGHIAVDSKVGNYSEFTIRLPRKP